MKKLARRIISQAKDHFIPHEGNGHVPHVLKHRALFGYGVVIVLLKVLVVLTPILLPASSLYSSSITPENVIILTNETRASLGLTALNENVQLDAAAAKKAQDMLANGYFAHVSPTGVTAWSFIKATGYRYTLAGENLAVHYVSAEDQNAGWMASPTHRANIVNPRFKDIGVGVAQGTFDDYPSTLVVQLFGEPTTGAATPTAPPPAPAAPAPDVKVTPQPSGYAIKVTSPNVTTASAQLGQSTATLTKAADGSFEGTVPVDPATAPSGEMLTVVTSTTGSTPTVTPVAMVVPQDPPKNLYAFAGDGKPPVKVLGIAIDNLDDGVRRFYLYVVLALIAATTISVLVKFHMKRLPIFFHAIVIVALGIGLMII